MTQASLDTWLSEAALIPGLALEPGPRLQLPPKEEAGPPHFADIRRLFGLCGERWHSDTSSGFSSLLFGWIRLTQGSVRICPAARLEKAERKPFWSHRRGNARPHSCEISAGLSSASALRTFGQDYLPRCDKHQTFNSSSCLDNNGMTRGTSVKVTCNKHGWA